MRKSEIQRVRVLKDSIDRHLFQKKSLYISLPAIVANLRPNIHVRFKDDWVMTSKSEASIVDYRIPISNRTKFSVRSEINIVLAGADEWGNLYALPEDYLKAGSPTHIIQEGEIIRVFGKGWYGAIFKDEGLRPVAVFHTWKQLKKGQVCVFEAIPMCTGVNHVIKIIE